MGVLAIGLLGVGALIPAGRHEIATAIRLEDAAMVGRNAFRDMQVRGYLSPGTADGATTYWYKGNSTTAKAFEGNNSPNAFNMNVAAGDSAFVMIDPLGIHAQTATFGDTFPYGATTSQPQLTRIVPFVPTSNAREIFDNIFRGSTDLTVDDTAGATFPPVQKFFQGPTPPDPIRRASAGDYSWVATICPSKTGAPSLTNEVVVSIAVFHKRDLSVAGAGEYTAEFDTSGTFDLLSNATVDLKNFVSNAATAQPIKGLRPGQWIMVAEIGGNKCSCRWYRVLSAAPYDKTNNLQTATLAGPPWPVLNQIATRVWIMDNVVAVYEKTMPLDIR
jgi:hypothetical protein